MTPGSVLRAGLVAWVALSIVAGAAIAAGLPISLARERAASFAQTTCGHDESCTGSGVRNCRRHSANVVLCRIVDRRRTERQGAFACTRLVRLALQPGTGRVPVTGLGPWSC